MTNSNSSVSGSGLSLASVLGIVFIVLKLVGVINWSWLWVLAPFWIPLVLFASIFLIAAIVILFNVTIKGIKERSKMKKMMR